ncbi:serine hydrolase [Escherichia coli]|nr:serine hydrolase [Escherichia coli]
MIPERGASPCNNTLAAIGSGGVHSTPGDMMRWMQQYLSSDFYQRSNQADRMQTLIYQRNAVYESDWRGCPRQRRCAWFRLGIYEALERGSSGDYSEDRIGGGGFITYMAMIPQKNIGAFVAVTRVRR